MKKNVNNCFSIRKNFLTLGFRLFVFSFATTAFGLTPNVYSLTNKTTLNNQQQQATISGTIIDGNGLPIPGITILEKGTSNGTMSDFDGNFSFTPSKSNSILVFSSIGYTTKELTITNQTTLKVTLEENISELDEVIVVGFGSQSKKKVSSSVSQITAEELGTDTRPVTNLSSALVGAVPGLNSSNSSGGAPGTVPDFSIRGTSSLNSTSVLVIIDDFEGDLADINPQDIESTTVLKDAAAVAIYGARGANGVLLVTTKKTKRDKKTRITYNVSNSIQAKGSLPDIMTSGEYIDLVNTASPGFFGDDVIQLSEDGFYPETQWADALYEDTASQQSHNLTLTGGTEKVGFLMSTGYLNQEGLARGTDNFQRLNLRLKLDANITDWLEVGTNTLITNRVTNSVPVITGTNLLGSPFVPVVTEDGYYTDKSSGLYGGEVNPIAYTESGSFTNTERNNINLQLYAKLTPFKGFTIQQSVSILKNNTNYRDFNNVYDYVTLDITDPDSYTNSASTLVQGSSDNRTLTLYSATSNTTTALTRINYDFNINNVHNFKTFLGFQAIKYDYQYFAASRSGFGLDDPISIDLGENPETVGGEALGNTETIDETSTISYFGRLSYDYKAKYIFEASFRYDGSSYFAENNRYGFFPSASAAWNIKSESFLKKAKWIDDLKIRSSYGLVGDDSGLGGNYTVQLASYNASGGYPIGNVTNPTVKLSTYANPDLKWETSKIFNVGLDFSLWDGKFQIATDYFVNNRTDILDLAQVPDEFGFGDVPANLYDVKSWGWEIELTHKNKIGNDFSYWVNGNFSDYDNEITDLDGYDSANFAVGQSVNDIYGYVTDGFFDNQEEIDTYVGTDGNAIDQSQVGSSYIGGFKYKDQLTIDSDGDGVFDTADGIINADDKVILDENSTTNYRFGFNLGFNYKKLSVAARFYGALDKVQYWNNANAHEPFIGSNAFAYQANYWSEDNTNAFLPTPTTFGTQSYDSAVSHFIRRNDFIKMQNITIGYDLSSTVKKRFKFIESLNLNLSVENLGVIWTNSPIRDYGWDPEIYTGTVNYTLPITTSFGLNVKF